MSTPLGHSPDAAWFALDPKDEHRDCELVLGDGTTVSLLKSELRHLVKRDEEKSGTAADCQMLEGKLIGLAFSGGGIRSATFGLGVLEGLKEFGLLEQFHFLSTVSGGGYLGGWLSANCVSRKPETGEATGPREWLSAAVDWSGAIGYLRRYSKYLSPDFGFASADTWSMVTIWIRNAMLVQLTVVLAIAAVMLLPRLLMPAFGHSYHAGDLRWASIILYLLAVVGIAGNQRRLLANKDELFLKKEDWLKGLIASAVLFVLAWQWAVHRRFEPFTNEAMDVLTTVVLSLLLLSASYCLLPAGVAIAGFYGMLRKAANPPRRLNYTQPWVQTIVVLPLMVAAFLVAAVLWGQATDPENHLSELKTFGALFTDAWRYWPLPLAIAFVSFVLLSFSSLRSLSRWLAWVVVVLAPTTAALTLHALLCAIMLLVHSWVHDAGGQWEAFVWAPSLLLYAFSIAIVVLLGILGRETSEAVREWWSRLGAWLVIYGLAWLLVAVVAVYGPWGATAAFSADTWQGVSISLGWILTTAAGLLAGNSPKTSGRATKDQPARVREWLTQLAPFVYIAGLLIAIATCLHLIIVAYSIKGVDLSATSLAKEHWSLLAQSTTFSVNGVFRPSAALTAYLVASVTIVLLLLFAWRVDINEFSLNTFYRSRLVRCYLGATRDPSVRRPQNFTGFDESDDLAMSGLIKSKGPLHIVNCSLNLGGSSDLALHTRHSASFTITPLSIGSHYRSSDGPGEPKRAIGFRETLHYGGAHGPTTLGKAISVSGAAASPNMGYHSSPVVAFVLTMFNARLGWWFARPRNKQQVASSSPALSLRYLLKELFASADDRSNFVMVSDGGHFENLAVYELIRRRCRVIVASDAECDPALRFEGLGTLKRMCEVDFGVTIDIDVSSLLPDARTGWSRSRCAVGRIVYDAGNRSRDGVFIYLKASMNGHEDAAILQYKAAHPAFPHESTGNQFYGEDQFESYRKLGKEVAMRTFEPVIDGTSPVDLADAADKLVSIWTPSLLTNARFAEHGDRLTGIWSQLGDHETIRLFDAAQEGFCNDKWPDDASNETFRAAFYLSSQIIQLMENVYMDLDLENTWQHPDNAGWQEQFKLWARSPAIFKTWERTSHTFGKRFRYFCNRHLKLPLQQ